ncbi:MAG: hypothetical protein PQJ44_02720 [Sphaerochaetaceae bacterium]|nr:hypothetical protein [Sphaerochaetaceae bacterium]
MSKFKTNDEYFEFSKRLVVIPTEEIKDLFIKYKLKLPCFVHGFLLKETIREAVFEEKLYNTYSDEQKFRLRGYDNYSIFPLEKLIRSYNLDFELSRYKELLFDFIFLNLDKLGIKGNFIKELEQLQHNYTVDLEVMKYDDFFQLFKPVIYSENGYLDGVLVKSYTDDVLASYTLGDLKGLGKKYDVNVPRRINKSKLIEILTAKFKLTEDESQLLAKKSVLDLEIYAKEKGFKISIDLKKRDMIEFIEFSMGMYHKPVYVDTFNYSIPLATEEEIVVADIEEEVKEVEPEKVVPVEEEVEEEVVQEPITEPVVEPVPEPKPTVKVEPEPASPVKPEPEPEPAKEQEPAEEVKKEPEPEPIAQVPEPVDEALLSNEEKELLDEKINQIIKRYYKKRRRRRTTWIIVIVLILAILAFAAYSYLYYQSNASLPFGIPVFW